MTRISAIDGIHRRYLHDEVAERIRELVRSGELEPNSRVNELELAERFGISRTPLREAIKILATEGMLELLPNRGARVAAVNEAEIDEMLEVIAGLEANAARLLVKRITDARLRRSPNGMRRCSKPTRSATRRAISPSTDRSMKR